MALLQLHTLYTVEDKVIVKTELEKTLNKAVVT
jgi:hypothetical protein